ncbi:hypothetical protein D1872_200800 [compost metagenome]
MPPGVVTTGIPHVSASVRTSSYARAACTPFPRIMTGLFACSMMGSASLIPVEVRGKDVRGAKMSNGTVSSSNTSSGMDKCTGPFTPVRDCSSAWRKYIGNTSLLSTRALNLVTGSNNLTISVPKAVESWARALPVCFIEGCPVIKRTGR